MKRAAAVVLAAMMMAGIFTPAWADNVKLDKELRDRARAVFLCSVLPAGSRLAEALGCSRVIVDPDDLDDLTGDSDVGGISGDAPVTAN